MPFWVALVGWVSKSILVLLLGLSVWSVAIMIDRRRFFRVRVTPERMREGLLRALAGLETRNPETIEYASRAFLTQQRMEMEKGLAVLATLGSNAPFIGLLGTVLGIIQAFAELGRQVGGTEAVMVGLSEALVATGVGLFVAIPAVVAYNYFSKIEKEALQACDVVKNQVLAGQPGLTEKPAGAPSMLV